MSNLVELPERNAVVSKGIEAVHCNVHTVNATPVRDWIANNVVVSHELNSVNCWSVGTVSQYLAKSTFSCLVYRLFVPRTLSLSQVPYTE